MAKFNWYDGTIVDIQNVTDSIRRFFIEVPERKHFSFKPGQFINLDLPIDSKKKIRQYSIASSPNGTNVLELIIVKFENGLGTSYLFDKSDVGTNLKVSDALGKFVLPEKIETDICFICTGVGIAPIRSMYLNIFKNNIPHKNIYLVFGTRYQNDLLFINEINELQEKHPEFHYLPTLSREDSPEWQGHRGYVHPVYMEEFADGRPAQFYICGWKEMIMEARDNLYGMGYDRKDVKFELFD